MEEKEEGNGSSSGLEENQLRESAENIRKDKRLQPYEPKIQRTTPSRLMLPKKKLPEITVETL